MYKKTNALILREVRYKEADRILTMMTQTEGKMGAKAPGALRKGSKLGAGTQSLCYSEVTLYEYKGKWSVKEAVTLEEFQGLRLDLARLSLAVYFAECVETLAQEGVPDGEMLQLILNSLYALSRDLCDPVKIKCAFEVRLMTIAGFRPVLEYCWDAGKRTGIRCSLLPLRARYIIPTAAPPTRNWWIFPATHWTPCATLWSPIPRNFSVSILRGFR